MDKAIVIAPKPICTALSQSGDIRHCKIKVFKKLIQNNLTCSVSYKPDVLLLKGRYFIARLKGTALIAEAEEAISYTIKLIIKVW
jgi:hypothetical protein